jgi:predicted CoA-binding protein
MTTDIHSLLKNTKTIAVVGLSDKPGRASHDVSRYMQSQGYRIIPVNPGCTEILGQKCYPDLKSIPEPVDMVNVFRKAEDCMPVAIDAVVIGAKSLWLQLGIINEEAEKYGKDHGLIVVMDRCLMIDHRRLRY